jgi:putative spermidine/putrescine transport system substrate-binding protein
LLLFIAAKPDTTAQNAIPKDTPMTKTTLRALMMATAFSIPSLAYADDAALAQMPWDDITAAARGGEVNFFMWGGADTINAYVSDYIGARLLAEYDITLNRVGVTDAADVVSIVLSEKEAGNLDAGSVDLIWINGENFRTMKQGDLAFCGYTEALPNNALINWDNPAIANDFGTPVDGCEVPWNKAQFAFAYDSAKMPTPPADMPALLEWIRANPGQFTYPAPPDFNGSVFVRHVFYHAAGGAEALLGPFDQAKFDDVAAKTWAILNDLKPYLWREGATYPSTITQLNDLYSNGEVAMTFDYDAAQFGLGVQSGKYPDSTRSYGLADGTIGNTNYTAIPFNSPNKAAAMVAQNLMLSGAAQFEKARPDVWGAAPVIELDRLDGDAQADFATLVPHPSVVSATELGRAALPELQADWIAAIEAGWLQNVAQ